MRTVRALVLATSLLAIPAAVRSAAAAGAAPVRAAFITGDGALQELADGGGAANSRR